MGGLEYRKWFSLKTIMYEATSIIFWREVFVEFLVCTILAIFVMLIVVTTNPHHYEPNVTHFGLFAGFLVYMLIEGYGPVGGAHLNPAASFALCVAGHISWLRSLMFIIAQVLGTAAGAGIGFGMNPKEAYAGVNGTKGFPVIKPSPMLSDGQCFAIEACLTFNLLFVALSVSDNMNRKASLLPSLPVGLAIGMGIMAAGTHTGGLQNPIVPLSPAIGSGDFERHWVYWVGPFVGATCGALSYELIQWIKRYNTLPYNQEVHRMTIMGVEHHPATVQRYDARKMSLPTGVQRDARKSSLASGIERGSRKSSLPAVIHEDPNQEFKGPLSAYDQNDAH